MTFFDKPYKPECIQEWLIVATKDLVPSAQDRISKEILAHNEEAVAAQVAEGMSETAASKRALEELGDALAARKEFQKSHLLESEQRYLNRMLDRSSFRHFVWKNWPIFILLAGQPLTSHKALTSHAAYWIELLTSFFCAVVAPTVLYLASKGKSPRAIFWLRMLAESIGGFGFLLLMKNFVGQTTPMPYTLSWLMIQMVCMLPWIYPFTMVWEFWVRKRLWKKVGPDYPAMPNKPLNA